MAPDAAVSVPAASAAVAATPVTTSAAIADRGIEARVERRHAGVERVECAEIEAAEACGIGPGTAPAEWSAAGSDEFQNGSEASPPLESE
jgi:hypothetical protein